MSTTAGRRITTGLATLLLATLALGVAQPATAGAAERQRFIPEHYVCKGLGTVPGLIPGASPNAVFDWVRKAAKTANSGNDLPFLNPATSYLEATVGNNYRHVQVCVYQDGSLIPVPGCDPVQRPQAGACTTEYFCPPEAAPGTVTSKALVTRRRILIHECYQVGPDGKQVFTGYKGEIPRRSIFINTIGPFQRNVLSAVGCYRPGRKTRSGKRLPGKPVFRNCGKARYATHLTGSALGARLQWKGTTKKSCSRNPRRAYRDLQLALADGDPNRAVVTVWFCNTKLKPRAWTVPWQRLIPKPAVGSMPPPGVAVEVPVGTTPGTIPGTPPTPPPPPPLDTDGDSVPDAQDVCDTVPGNYVTPEGVNNGCPVTDPDGDGLDNDHDLCQHQAGHAILYGSNPPVDTGCQPNRPDGYWSSD